MDIIIKYFNQLTNDELYDLLQLRSEVFVVEQQCIYQDIDGKDPNALHVLGYKNKQLVAYTRSFRPGDYFDEAAIGRVVVKEPERKFKLGYRIMEATIEAIHSEFSCTRIKLSAQTYLIKFYHNQGFRTVGEEYLEDGIPHILMIKT